MKKKNIDHLVANLSKIVIKDIPNNHFILYITTDGPAVLRMLPDTGIQNRPAEFGFFYLCRALTRNRANYKFITNTPSACMAARPGILAGDHNDIVTIIKRTMHNIGQNRIKDKALYRWHEIGAFPTWGTLRLWEKINLAQKPKH